MTQRFLILISVIKRGGTIALDSIARVKACCRPMFTLYDLLFPNLCYIMPDGIGMSGLCHDHVAQNKTTSIIEIHADFS